MLRIIKESKKVTESFREDFFDWYDGLSDTSEVEQYMEDEGMPDMVSDLSRTDMENILDHFDSDRLEDIYAQEDEDLEESVHPVTESFREDFLDWYDLLSDEKREEVDSFIEDEGYPDMITDLSEADMEIIMDEFNPEYFDTDYEDEEDLDEGCKTEDTIKKSNGKWTNKGKNGEHGEFKTKKAADAQRKAMFANGYKTESSSATVDKLVKPRRDDLAIDEEEDGYILTKAYYQDPYKALVYKKDDSAKVFIFKYGKEEKHEGDILSYRKSFKKYDEDEIYSWITGKIKKTEAYGDSLRDAPNPYYDKDEEYSDFDDGEVRSGDTFIEEGEEYEWVDQASDVYYLDFDAWQVWKATSVDSGEDAYFVVDKDTGFIDWGPCEEEEEAIEFLRSKVDDYNLDESYSPSDNSIDTLLKINEFDGYRVETYLNELGYDSDNTPNLSQIPDDVARKVVSRIKNDYKNDIDKYGDDAQVPFEAFELLNL